MCSRSGWLWHFQYASHSSFGKPKAALRLLSACDPIRHGDKLVKAGTTAVAAQAIQANYLIESHGTAAQGVVDLTGIYRIWNPRYKSYSVFSQDHLMRVLLGMDTTGTTHDAVRSSPHITVDPSQRSNS